MTRKKKFHGKDIPSEHARRRQEQEEKTKDMAAGIRANRVTLSDVQKGYTEEGRVPVRLSDNTVVYARPGQTKEQVRAKYQKSII